MSHRMQAFSNLIIGEMISKEYNDSQEQCEKALEHLKTASELYTNNTKVLSQEEYSRVNLSLSTLYRLQGD